MSLCEPGAGADAAHYGEDFHYTRDVFFRFFMSVCSTVSGCSGACEVVEEDVCDGSELLGRFAMMNERGEGSTYDCEGVCLGFIVWGCREVVCEEGADDRGRYCV